MVEERQEKAKHHLDNCAASTTFKLHRLGRRIDHWSACCEDVGFSTEVSTRAFLVWTFTRQQQKDAFSAFASLYPRFICDNC
jgi:hypothetical protein